MNQISLVESLKVLKSVRTDEVVVSVMGAAREWVQLGSHPLDFVYVPSSMGQATALGLGLALARPDRRVVVCNGDGSLLMNLGSLVTITAHAPKNLTLIIFDNGVYEVTGIQNTPGAAAARSDRRAINYCEVARACGFDAVYEFDELEQWRNQVQSVLTQPGPVFALVKVATMTGSLGPKSPGPAKARALQFAAALRSSE